jgi:uncharacterized protein
MSHRGSLLILPSGMRAWEPTAPIAAEDFADVLPEKSVIDVLLVGTGKTMVRLVPAVAKYLEEQGVMFYCMSTSSAIHTYNIMLAEDRRVAAALVVVDG